MAAQDRDCLQSQGRARTLPILSPWLSTLRNPPAIFGVAPKDLQGQIKVLKSIRATTGTSSGCYLVCTEGGHSR